MPLGIQQHHRLCLSCYLSNFLIRFFFFYRIATIQAASTFTRRLQLFLIGPYLLCLACRVSGGRRNEKQLLRNHFMSNRLMTKQHGLFYTSCPWIVYEFIIKHVHPKQYTDSLLSIGSSCYTSTKCKYKPGLQPTTLMLQVWDSGKLIVVGL